MAFSTYLRLIFLTILLLIIGCDLNTNIRGNFDLTYDLTIENGSGWVNNNSVTLNFKAPSFTRYYLIADSEASCLSSKNFNAFQSEINYDLGISGSMGAKSIWFKFADESKIESDCFNDSVTLDTLLPSPVKQLRTVYNPNQSSLTESPFITWDEDGGANGAPIVSYQARVTQGTTIIYDWTTISKGQAITNIDPPLDPDTNYNIEVVSIDKASNKSDIAQSMQWSSARTLNDVFWNPKALLASRITVHDLDLDGDNDLVSETKYGIYWQENDGSGNFFKRLISYNFYDQLKLDKPIDFDADGDLDIIGFSSTTGKLFYFENDGEFNFSKRLLVEKSGNEQAFNFCQSMDFDNDTDIDIVCYVTTSSPDDQEFVMFKNTNGSISKEILHTVSQGTIVNLMNVGDLDSDGDFDILFSAADSSKWLDNDGSLSFTEKNAASGYDSIKSQQIIDMDLDGDMDILTHSWSDDRTAWHRNNGSEVFTLQTISTTFNVCYFAYAADIDKDNDIDVVVAGEDASRGYKQYVAWFKNNGSMSFTKTDLRASESGKVFSDSGDLDGDGDIDIVTTDNRYNSGWYTNDGSSNFTFNSFEEMPRGISDVVSIDMDGDGDLDSVISSIFDTGLIWFENKGNGVFYSNKVFINSDEQGTTLEAGDFDGDQDIDLILGSNTGVELRFFRNDGSQNFTTETISSSVLGANDLFKIDLDKDGDLDFVYGGYESSGEISWFENDGSASFTRYTIKNSTGYAQGVHAMDFDGDNDIDVIGALKSEGVFAWYENDGSQNFTEHVIHNLEYNPGYVMGEDIDGDGDTDVGFVSDDACGWFRNDGGGTFTEADSRSTSRGTGLAVGDFDSDGDVDVLCSDRSFNALILMENDGTNDLSNDIIIYNVDDVRGFDIGDFNSDGVLDFMSGSKGNELIWGSFGK